MDKKAKAIAWAAGLAAGIIAPVATWLIIEQMKPPPPLGAPPQPLVVQDADLLILPAFETSSDGKTRDAFQLEVTLRKPEGQAYGGCVTWYQFSAPNGQGEGQATVGWPTDPGVAIDFDLPSDAQSLRLHFYFKLYSYVLPEWLRLRVICRDLVSDWYEVDLTRALGKP